MADLIPVGATNRSPSENNSTQRPFRVDQAEAPQAIGDGEATPPVERRQGDRCRGRSDRRSLRAGQPRTDRRHKQDRRAVLSARKGQELPAVSDKPNPGRKGRIIDERV